MSYSKRDFIRELKTELCQTFNLTHLPHWAAHIYYQHLHELDDDVQDEILMLATLDQRAGFEMTPQEFRKLVHHLEA